MALPISHRVAKYIRLCFLYELAFHTEYLELETSWSQYKTFHVLLSSLASETLWFEPLH
jgi:hypothetical protein